MDHPYFPVQSRRAYFRPALFCLPGAVLVACTSLSVGASRGTAQLDEVIRWGEPLLLEDRHPTVITVLPVLSFEPAGTLLISDRSEQFVRRYRQDGRLIVQFGGEGDGPAEYRAVAGAARLGERIYAADRSGKVTVSRLDGTLVGTHTLPLSPVYEIQRFDDGTLIVAGRNPNSSETPLIHLWDVERQELTASFFSVPAHPARLAGAYEYAGIPNFAVHGDTVAVSFALSDTLYRFTRSGQPLDKLPLPLRTYRRLTQPPPPPPDERAQVAWLESFSRISQIFATPNGSYLVQFFDRSGAETRWNLLHVTRSGQPQFELRDSPRLIGVSPATGQLVFKDPQSLEPNRWVLASFAP